MSITTNWKGRIDGENSNELRWHQIVVDAQKTNNYANAMVIVGFESDEGVRRNKGRTGAAQAPNVLRQTMSNFPADELSTIYDFGNVPCENTQLEKAQKNLSDTIENIYLKNGKSLVLGGGHEVTYPHFSALQNTFPNEKIGIINFDAHFDNRPITAKTGINSGTGFYQIAENTEIHSLHIGIQKNSNTKALFDYAHQKGMQYILAQDFYLLAQQSKSQILQFIQNIDLLYVTVCMDVFSSAFAPGVSATAYNGMIPDAYFLSVFQEVVSHSKLKAFDVAEVNPNFDIDNRTAKLAASLVFDVLNA